MEGGRRLMARDLVAVVFAGGLLTFAVRASSDGMEFSRLLVAYQLVFGIVALLLIHEGLTRIAERR
jgi:hypothetical protein